jgi:hypothetical protein
MVGGAGKQWGVSGELTMAPAGLGNNRCDLVMVEILVDSAAMEHGVDFLFGDATESAQVGGRGGRGIRGTAIQWWHMGAAAALEAAAPGTAE